MIPRRVSVLFIPAITFFFLPYQPSLTKGSELPLAGSYRRVTTQTIVTVSGTTSSLIVFTMEFLTMTIDYMAVRLGRAPRPGACIYLPLAFEGRKGKRISFAFASTSPLDFYTMSEEQYMVWYDGKVCPVTMALVEQEDVDRLEGEFIVC